MENKITEDGIILTSTVKIKSEVSSLLPVKTDKPIPKDKLKKAMKILAKLQAKAPIFVGDIIKKLNTKVDDADDDDEYANEFMDDQFEVAGLEEEL
jgi:CxxC motif-containing protein